MFVVSRFRDQISSVQACEATVKGTAIILFALDVEARPTLRQLENSRSLRWRHSRVRIGKLAGAPLCVAVIGAAGEARAAQATAELLERVQPSFVISAGFAGALSNHLQVGDILLPACVTHERQEELAIEPWSAEVTASAAIHHGGRLLTVSRLIGSRDERQALAAQYHALACDMESWAIANACREHGVPFRALRIISDEVAAEFPPELEHVLAASSPGRQALAAAGAILRRPALCAELWQLRRRATGLAQRLGEAIPAVLTNAIGQGPENSDHL